MAKAAFRAHPSQPKFYYRYLRDVPLEADVVEFDRSGEYDNVNFWFRASEAKIMCFHFNLLWAAVPDTGMSTPLFFISKDNGVSWQEVAGTDQGASNNSSPNPQGQVLVSLVPMEEGWLIRAIPCNAFGNGWYPITNAENGGYATCNYFEGFEI